MAGPLPIPIEDALLTYCTYHGIAKGELRECMADMVEALDNEYLDAHFKKQEAKAAAKK